ncbi:MAG: hypothetical protein IID51_02700 [Proteobacteria bacterium]|nr:hypothetical protein [Pseudomonadota bacterium]
MSAGTENQIEIATEFLLSAVGPGAPDLANEELRRAFRGGDFDQTRYWRAVKDRSIRRLIDEGLLEGPAVGEGEGNNVIYADFGLNHPRGKGGAEDV